MKNTIYYFTGTGNSYAISRDLVNELGEDVELIPVVKTLSQESIIIDSDVVGIVFPAWLHQAPPIMKEFINKAIFKSTYIYAICSYSTNPHNAIFNLNSLLEQKGSKLDAGFAIAMGGKYIILKDLVFPEEENESRYVEEKLKIKEITQIIKERKSVGIEGQYDEADKDYGKLLIDTHMNSYKVVDKFWLTGDCNLCGLCVNLCPRNNIKITADKVIWGNNCDYCLACLHWCPRSSIQNGELTQNGRRQHHPEVSVEDIINQKE